MPLPKKILLIDDDEGFNFLNRIILNGSIAGCNVEEALNGGAALDLLKKEAECPEVILLDINMPGMDGFEFLDEFERIKKCEGHTKIFILTSSSRPEDRQHVAGHKAVAGYFDKPLNDAHVAEILQKTG